MTTTASAKGTTEGPKAKQRITPMLWYDTQAEEAANFYCSIFKNSKINSVARYGDTGPGPKGQVMVVAFELDGQEFTALNGGPMFKFTEAISMVVNCETQEEIDTYWEKLSAGGQEIECGWLKDKYGLCWQITPAIISEYWSKGDQEQLDRVMAEVMKTKKFDIQKLKDAYEGK
ncbi:MAG TPA: VOC family protein [Pyrinomonadaceae bacterium]|nr:VOC family protein [Pyrinomonadaceae bacterium]